MVDDETPENVSLDIPEDKLELIQDILSSMEVGDRTALERLKKNLTDITNNRLYLFSLDDPNYKPSNYMSREEVNTAYLYALDISESTPEECFNQVMEVFGVSKDYINEAKDNPSFHIKDVISDNIKHSKVIKMNKNKVLDVKTLKKTTTPNQLINTITTRRSVSDRLDKLEDDVIRLSQDLDNVKLKQIGSDLAIDNLNTTLLGIELTKEKKKENCILLRNQGYTIKQISTILSISESTVKRNLLDKTILIDLPPQTK